MTLCACNTLCSSVTAGAKFAFMKEITKANPNVLLSYGYKPLMSSIERKYCLISTSCLTGLFDISILLNI